MYFVYVQGSKADELSLIGFTIVKILLLLNETTAELSNVLKPILKGPRGAHTRLTLQSHLRRRLRLLILLMILKKTLLVFVGLATGDMGS